MQNRQINENHKLTAMVCENTFIIFTYQWSIEFNDNCLKRNHWKPMIISIPLLVVMFNHMANISQSIGIQAKDSFIDQYQKKSWAKRTHSQSLIVAVCCDVFFSLLHVDIFLHKIHALVDFRKFIGWLPCYIPHSIRLFKWIETKKKTPRRVLDAMYARVDTLKKTTFTFENILAKTKSWL